MADPDAPEEIEPVVIRVEIPAGHREFIVGGHRIRPERGAPRICECADRERVVDERLGVVGRGSSFNNPARRKAAEFVRHMPVVVLVGVRAPE